MKFVVCALRYLWENLALFGELWQRINGVRKFQKKAQDLFLKNWIAKTWVLVIDLLLLDLDALQKPPPSMLDGLFLPSQECVVLDDSEVQVNFMSDLLTIEVQIDGGDELELVRWYISLLTAKCGLLGHLDWIGPKESKFLQRFLHIKLLDLMSQGRNYLDQEHELVEFSINLIHATMICAVGQTSMIH